MVTRTFEQITFKWLSFSAWADVPPANEFKPGTRITVSNLGGGAGSDWISNGTRWTPLGGMLTLAALAAPSAAIAAVETIVMQCLIPAAAWQTNDVLRITRLCEKSGATDNLLSTVRIGTVGDLTDTAVTGEANSVLLAAADLCGGGQIDIKLLAAASAQRMGAATGASFIVSTTPQPPATVITSAAANALYVSQTIASSGANDTVTLLSGQIQLITP